MTIFICDGENILMDKVTELTYSKGAYNLKDPVSGNLGSHYESKSKLHILQPPKAAKCWGETVKLFTMIGTVDDHWSDILTAKSIDVKDIFTANHHWDFLCKDTRLIILDGLDTIVQISFDKDSSKWMVTEATQEAYKSSNGLTIQGYGAKDIESFAFTNNVQLTALEALVFSQTLTDKLGMRFDHYHIPTGKMTYDCDLTIRQRDHIMDKIENRMKLSRRYDSVYLSNMV